MVHNAKVVNVLMFSKESPEDFMNILNDPMLELQDTVIQMFSSGVLQFKNNQKDVHFNYLSSNYPDFRFKC